MAIHIITDEEKSAAKNKKIKIAVILIVIICIAIGVYMYPKKQKIETLYVSNQSSGDSLIQGLTGSELKTQSSSESGSMIRADTGIDPEWGVANNKVDRLKSDPALQSDPVKFKKAIEQLNKETNGIIDSNRLSLNEVKSHASKDDCWTVIDGYVYNITEFVGTQKDMIPLCGTDGTESFKKMYTGDMSVENTIYTMKIGVLQK